MNILITGNSGFIGWHLTRALVSDGHEVIGVDVHPSTPPNLLYRQIGGDIRDEGIMDEAADGADLVIHLAARHHDFGVPCQEFFSVNVDGTKLLLNAARKRSIRRIVFLSTVAVYEHSTDPLEEDAPLNPTSDYGKSKLAAEKLLKEWVLEEESRSLVIIRPALVFGPRNFANMYNLIRQIAKRRYIQVGKGSNIKSIAYVENLVAAIVFLIEHPRTGVRVYNYVDYPQLTTRHIVEIISKNLGISVPTLRCPYRFTVGVASIFDMLGAITGHNFSITAYRIRKFCTTTHYLAEKIRQERFAPPVPLEEGFARTIRWLRENRFI